MTLADTGGARLLGALHHALGDAVLSALSEPDVVEVMANPNGRLVIDRVGRGRLDTGLILAMEARERVIRLVADHVGEIANRENPRLSGVLPSGERFQGVLPPLSQGPAWAIRKRPLRVWSLRDYADQGILTTGQMRTLQEAIEGRLNIVISGGTGSGKTTLANALLAEAGFREDRIFLIEDTAELMCEAWDCVQVLTRRTAPVIGVGDLVRDALRMRPDRIVVGELRDGAAALETLKSWNTGHPGGLCTLHANSAIDALKRLRDLIGEVSAQPPLHLIGQTIDRLVHIKRTADGRRIDAILEVNEDETHGYRTAPAS